jgi:hypothetical protein
MAVCSYCGQEMCGGTDDCPENETLDFPSGVAFAAIPYKGVTFCPDCAVRPGGHHHPGCGEEECPACGGRLAACGCLECDDDDECDDD